MADIYTWICLRFDRVGLITAELRQNNETVDILGGSYSKWTPTLMDAQDKWGRDIPIHWDGFEVPEIAGIIQVDD